MDKNLREMLLLATVSIVLLGVVLGAILVEPLIAIGLAPILLAIAAIIRAIRGDAKQRRSSDHGEVGSDSPPPTIPVAPPDEALASSSDDAEPPA